MHNTSQDTVYFNVSVDWGEEGGGGGGTPNLEVLSVQKISTFGGLVS
jgi:hypothetical protein